MPQPVYALNLFNISNVDEYLAYSKRSAREVAAHGGRLVALGKFREAAAGDVEPRSVLILVEWASKEAFDGYCNDPRVPVQEAEQIAATVGRNGVPVWTMIAENEGHGFGKKENADYLFYARVLFLETFLLPTAPQTAREGR